MEPETSPEKIQGTIDAGGLRTYYEIEGVGEPLVLLHGGLCTIETLADLTPLLAANYRVYQPERRGHGRTPDVDGPITYDAMAEDTIAFLDALPLPAAHVVGWSDGALVALLVALRRPDLVRRMVMIGQYINLQGIPPESAAALNQDTMPGEPPTVLRETYAAVSPDGPAHWDVVVAKIWHLFRTEPNLDLAELTQVAAPTLLLMGDQDVLTVEHAEAMRSALPDGQLVIVPNATHWLPVEQPAVVARLISDFLSEPHR